jgi:predicted nucleotidyltransferase component of viral defense system
MDRSNPSFRRVELLVRVLPYVAKQKCFALKGGTAINLFVRNLPRLSVDIDLVYLPLDPREKALPAIQRALREIDRSLTAAMPGIKVQATNPKDTDSQRLTLSLEGRQIKIELSPVLRGAVWPTETRSVVEAVEDTLGYAEIQVVSLNDLYAGKICAALDRQHPRDLFDIKLLFENEGISRDLFKTFLVYLISHRRPMAELLSPARKDIRAMFGSEFKDMTREPVTFDQLLEVRERLIREVQGSLTDADRDFLLSVKGRRPDWSLLDLPGIDKLPSVQWKLHNLNRMSDDKHQMALAQLEAIIADSIG